MAGRESDNNAVILEIQRMSTEDGPGIRTTVFFKGCTLRCAWCHNPESLSPKPQIHWVGVRCIGCGICIKACPNKALSSTDKGISIDRKVCAGCGACAKECPSTAMELLGKTWELHALIREVLKDRAYFEKSGGGVTISGGEPTAQARFSAAFLKGLQDAGIHTALDTCGMCPKENLEMILPHADLVLFDIKLIDSARHKALTGAANDLILSNLATVARSMKERGAPSELWIRTPVIPEATSSRENVAAIGRYLAANLNGAVSRWELCSFNNLCRDKYVRLGMDWAYKEYGLVAKSAMEDLAAAAADSGVDPKIVHWSGATA